MACRILTDQTPLKNEQKKPTVYLTKMHFKSSAKFRPVFPAWTKLPPDCRRQFQSQNTRCVRTFQGNLGLGHQQPLSKWYMYAPWWITIYENHIFMYSKQFGAQRIIKKQSERVTSRVISCIPNKSGHCNQYAISIGIVATNRSDGRFQWYIYQYPALRELQRFWYGGGIHFVIH